VGAVVLKRVLLIAFQYPPMTGSSGIQRALRFSQYLPQFGWEPIVLTAHPRAYERTSTDQLQDISPSTQVERAFALDCARHLAVRGRYLESWATPDRWASWRFGAIPKGLALIRNYRPAVIWSTFPIPTAHQIGLSLQMRSGLPWVADFRDVMTEPDYPSRPSLWNAWRTLEQATIRHCVRAVFTTAGAAAMYSERYCERPRQTFEVIENGYDEQTFAQVDAAAWQRRDTKVMRIVHSGVVYPSERDPRNLFTALRILRDEGTIGNENFRLVLRATGHDDHIRGLIEAAGVRDLVELAPALPYGRAVAEMVMADALLLLQASNCSRQIPAKLYEYLRSGRPIVGLASADTADALLSAGIDAVAPLESVDAVTDLLRRFVGLLRSGKAPGAAPEAVERHSRLHKTQELAQLLNAVS
jgi:glycosyltransferase involved in cell wall biosynthesis